MTEADAPEACPGLCCSTFPVGADGVGGIISSIWRQMRAPNANGNIAELVTIRDMLVPAETPAGKTWPYYTCVHFDGRHCTAYDSRPAYMCGEFPYGEACEHCSIGFTLGAPRRWVPVQESGIFTPWDEQ